MSITSGCFDRHAAEEAKLDDATLLLVERFQARESVVLQRQGVDGVDVGNRGRGRIDVVEREADGAAAR